MTAYCGISPVGSMNICRHIEIRASTISAFRFIAQKAPVRFRTNASTFFFYLYSYFLHTEMRHHARHIISG